MITLEQISKNYITPDGPLPALQDINLQVDTGEIFGIIGQSGAGKSTLIRCVNLLERPDQGTIRVDGKNLLTLSSAELRQARHNMGMIFQQFNLLSSRTVFENIALPLEFSKIPRADIEKRVTALLELTGLTAKKNTYPAQLSGGQKQRVAIARALAHQPKILLSDEATSALDPETTQAILQLLKNIRDTLKITILLITHEMHVIKSCCDKVGILQKGRLIESNEVGAFFAHPQTDVAKNFILSSLPMHLPLILEQHLTYHAAPNTQVVWRLIFRGQSTTLPVISDLISQFHLRITILQAQVEYIKNHMLGIMIVTVQGEAMNIENSIHYLKNNKIEHEVIGYVPNDILSFR